MQIYTENQVREVVRRELDARLRSPIMNSHVSPRGVSQSRVNTRVVTNLPRVANEHDEVFCETSDGSLVPFVYYKGSWRAVGGWQKWTYAIHEAGPLDASGSFTKEFDDTAIVLWASGSGFLSASNSLGIEIDIDGSAVGQLLGYTNETFSHKSLVMSELVFPDTSIPSDAIAKGTHTVSLVDAGGNVESDGNDYYYVLVLETFAVTT